MRLFAKQTQTPNKKLLDFGYLPEDNGYFDSACQTLRPQQVIDALTSYYHTYNACGGRVKYAWGQQVDREVAAARKKVLAMLGKSERDYVCSFTLNTTYGLNLILGQLGGEDFKQVVTSEIEHNSVFLPSMTLAKRLGARRLVLPRSRDGSLVYAAHQLEKSIVIVNSSSNIDGRRLANARQLCEDVHARGGAVIIDAAQSMGHDASCIKDVDYDAVCFSAHKMYGPSLGVVVAKKSLLEKLDLCFVGGGMVQDVLEDSFALTEHDLPSRLEAGLQDFGGIIALSAAIDWLKGFRPGGIPQKRHRSLLQERLFEGLQNIPTYKLITHEPSPVISFYSKKVDAHRIATFLSQNNIMVRSGYFCCHYYLVHKQKLPPLVRISIGLNNTPEQVERLVTTLEMIERNS